MRCCVCGDSTEIETAFCAQCAIRELPQIKIEKERTVDRCSTCLRYSVPPSGWISLRFEGPEMLAYLLKRIPELAKKKLVDAYFIHSEEHSKRIRMKIALDRTEEVQEHGKRTEYMEETEIKWIIRGKHCLDCAHVASKQTWSSVVQVRQKSKSKKTLLQLEAAVVKAGLHSETTDIKGVADGIDFFFKTKTPALKLVRFIEELVPTRVKSSEQLVTLDKKSSDSRYKFAYSVEIPALNKNDLLHLPDTLARKLAVSPMCAVIRVSKVVSLVDTHGTMKDLGRIEYYKHARDIQVLGTEDTRTVFEVVSVGVDRGWREKGDNGGLEKGDNGRREENTLNYGKNVQQNALLLNESGELVQTLTHVKGLREGEKVAGYELTHLYTNLEIDTPVFLLQREDRLEDNWRIKRISHTEPPQKTLQTALEEVKRSQKEYKKKPKEEEEERNKLTKDMRTLSISTGKVKNKENRE